MKINGSILVWILGLVTVNEDKSMVNIICVCVCVCVCVLFNFSNGYTRHTAKGGFPRERIYFDEAYHRDELLLVETSTMKHESIMPLNL